MPGSCKAGSRLQVIPQVALHLANSRLREDSVVSDFVKKKKRRNKFPNHVLSAAISYSLLISESYLLITCATPRFLSIFSLCFRPSSPSSLNSQPSAFGAAVGPQMWTDRSPDLPMMPAARLKEGSCEPSWMEPSCPMWHRQIFSALE